MVLGKYSSGTAGSRITVEVGGNGVGVVVGVVVAVGEDVGVFWTNWNGVMVGFASTTDWFCTVQAATVKIRQNDSSFFLLIGFIT